jgi:hypothetical protein
MKIEYRVFEKKMRKKIFWPDKFWVAYYKTRNFQIYKSQVELLEYWDYDALDM